MSIEQVYIIHDFVYNIKFDLDEYSSSMPTVYYGLLVLGADNLNCCLYKS